MPDLQVESHRGEQTVFPGPDDELLDGQVMQLIDLKVPLITAARKTSSLEKLFTISPTSKCASFHANCFTVFYLRCCLESHNQASL